MAEKSEKPKIPAAGSLTEDEKKALKKKTESEGGLMVQSREERGMRRSGILFGPDPIFVPNSIGEEKIAAIKAERKLSWLPVEGKAPKGVARVTPTGSNGPNVRVGGLRGNEENATPEQLEAANEGLALSHPSMAAGIGINERQPVRDLSATTARGAAMKLDGDAGKPGLQPQGQIPKDMLPPGADKTPGGDPGSPTGDDTGADGEGGEGGSDEGNSSVLADRVISKVRGKGKEKE